MPKGNYQIFGIGVVASCKIDVIKNKKCVPKFVFFHEKKIRKIPMIFHIEIDFESQILALFDTYPLHQFAKFNDFI